MNILQAMDDEKLFGKFFRKRLFRGDSWVAWKAFLVALFALEMNEAQREIYQKHTQRTDLSATQFNESFLICGRRSGKSVIAALIAVYLACFRDYSPYTVPGETLILPVVAPDRRQGLVLLNYIRGMLKESATLRSMVLRELTESIELTNGVKIEIVTASFRSSRGFTAIGCILDEVAFLRSDESANPDAEIIQALLPGMSTIPNALLLGISSPYARRGVLYERHKQFFGVAGAPVLVWQADTKSMNPTVNRLLIEAAYLRDRAAASAEYGAEFRSDIESFLSLELIESRVIRGRRELPYSSTANYTAFVDPSGGASDSMTLAIAHVDENGVGVLDLLREVKAPFSPEAVVAEFAQELRRFHISEICGDAYAAGWSREAFERHGLSYTTSERNRSQLYLELLPLLTSDQVRLLDHPGLVMQLSQLERRTSRFGRDTIDHPSGSHDDVCNAAAGALVLTMGGEGAELPLVVVMKKMAARVAAGLDFFEAKPKPAVPIAWPAGHSTPKPLPSEACPLCGTKTSIRIGSAGNPFRCPNDGTQFLAGGQIVNAPAGACCEAPVLRPIPGGFKKCDTCGAQSNDGGRIPHNGISRRHYQLGNYRRRQ